MIAILPPRITPAKFVDKWRPIALSERAAAQSHFNDLCDLVGHPRPLEVDPTGEWFTFEKGVKKVGGGNGFADVWKRGAFAWEYKKKHLNLDAALKQLSQYALALESPPLQIVCDTDRFRIVTAYTNSVPCSYDISLEDLLDAKKRTILETAFHYPKKLKPGADRADLTKTAADKFSTLTSRLQAKGHSPDDVAHFVNRLVFLFFAEDVGILDEGFFRKAISGLSKKPSEAKGLLTDLFLTLKTGGRFGLDRLPWINGGLFDDREALPLDEHEIGLLKAASSQDWAHIDPTIFGTLFERFLDPDKRAQIGAHYTDAEKIGQIVEPVILRPLREEWQTVRTDIEVLVKSAVKKGFKSKDWQRAEQRRSEFMERLRTLSILDPACGSGNFLYLALHGVKDLEHAANQECEVMGLPPRMPMVGPEILRGIEINPLAAELARTTIWIGDIQWAIQNGIRSRPEPILRRLDKIECKDALIDKDGAETPWPSAEFIIGNPPFLGAAKFLRSMHKDYVKTLRNTYKDRVPGLADLVSYWFVRAAEALKDNPNLRVGLVATNTIRQSTHHPVIDAIRTNGFLFDVRNDEPWVNDGAAVRVCLISFAKHREVVELNGKTVKEIGSDLTAISQEAQNYAPIGLRENGSLSFQGSQKIGDFDVPGHVARKWLKQSNPNAKPNSDVVRPLWNGIDITRRNRDMWVVDFGCELNEKEASLYEAPFEHVLKHVKPERDKNNREQYRRIWWRHGEARVGLRKAISGLDRFMAISEKSKHFYWSWVPRGILPDKRLIIVACDSDLTFGIVSSRFHKVWSLKMGSTLEDRPCYTPSTCFSTFPFPVGMTPRSKHARAKSEIANRIARAASELDRLRHNTLYPETHFFQKPEVAEGFPDRYLAKSTAVAADINKMTLTALYNKMPTWLINAHRELDRAVAAAYDWPEDISTEDALAALLELNRERAAAQGKA